METDDKEKCNGGDSWKEIASLVGTVGRLNELDLGDEDEEKPGSEECKRNTCCMLHDS